MKKKIAVLLVISMLFASVLFACGTNDTPSDTPTNSQSGENNTDGGEQGGENTGETEPTKYTANVEAFDWGGKEFKVLVNNENNVEWKDVDFTAEEQTGEPINDAVYNRNKEIEEMFNIVVTPYAVAQGDHVSSVRKAVNAGDGSIDIAFNTPFDTATLSQDGMLYDLFTVPNLDLSEPWWDPNAVSNLSIADRLYMVTGDIGTMYRKSVGIILFNKQMVQDYALTDPYQLVSSNKWTMDAFLDMCKQVSSDINGDGTWDDSDRFGLLGYCDIMPVSLIGCGVQIATKNAEDLPEITFYNEKTVSIFNKITEVVHNKELFWSWSREGSNNERSRVMFANGQGLFNWNEFHSIPNLRTMETDFGILPMPLYEEGQSRYYHTVNPHVAQMLTIPTSNTELEKTGAVVQAMGAISKNLLTPAYYDVSLIGKHARDDASVMTMDLIFSSISYDPGYMYNWQNIGTFTLSMVDTFKTDLASEYEKIANKVQVTLDKMVDKYLSLEE